MKTIYFHTEQLHNCAYASNIFVKQYQKNNKIHLKGLVGMSKPKRAQKKDSRNSREYRYAYSVVCVLVN